MLEGVKIVIPGGEGGLPLRVARCLGAVGARFVLLSNERDNVARMSTHCSHFIYSDPRSDSELLAQLLGMEPCSTAEIILPVTTDGFLFTSRNREALLARFKLPPASTLDSLRIASDKWTLYEFAIRNQIPVLRSTLLSDVPASAVEIEESTYVFPALVKSRRQESGKGTKKVGSAAELAALRGNLGSAAAEDCFVQRFVEGEDVSLSVFCEHGEIRSYTLWKALCYGTVEYQVPLCVTFGEDDRVLQIGRRLLKALDWNGVCDIDFFVERDSGEVWLLEVNARFWRNIEGCVSHGVNFPALMCERALAADRLVWPRQTDGVYCHPKGLGAALRMPGIRSAVLRNPIRVLGIAQVLRDPGPEFSKLFSKVRRTTRPRHGFT